MVLVAQRAEEARKLRERQLQALEAELGGLTRETESQSATLAQLKSQHDTEANAIRDVLDQVEVRTLVRPTRVGWSGVSVTCMGVDGGQRGPGTAPRVGSDGRGERPARGRA
jgi:hypothetical protein